MDTLRAPLKAEAYKIIKEKIISCEYKPGSILTEGFLTTELNNSRTPIREAIGILAKEDLVRVIPKKGIFVTDILLSDVMQIFQVRMEIEPLCIRLAKDNFDIKDLSAWKKRFKSPTQGDLQDKALDSKMHLFITDKCNNKYLIEMMHKVQEQNLRIVNYSKKNSEHIAAARIEHIIILDLLMEKEYEQAALKMKEHIDHCRKAALDYFYSVN